MTREQFSEAVRLMSNSLPCPQQEKRVAALYEFFGKKDPGVIERASRKASAILERFPTPRMFGEILGSVLGKEETKKRQECDRCDGYGWVMTEDGACRGRCIHGEALSAKIALAPENVTYHSLPPPKTASEIIDRLTSGESREDGYIRRAYRGARMIGIVKGYPATLRATVLEFVGQSQAAKWDAEVDVTPIRRFEFTTRKRPKELPPNADRPD